MHLTTQFMRLKFIRSANWINFPWRSRNDILERGCMICLMPTEREKNNRTASKMIIGQWDGRRRRTLSKYTFLRFLFIKIILKLNIRTWRKWKGNEISNWNVDDGVYEWEWKWIGMEWFGEIETHTNHHPMMKKFKGYYPALSLFHLKNLCPKLYNWKWKWMNPNEWMNEN